MARPCSAACYMSLSPASQCDCACGGANHGKGATSAPAVTAGAITTATPAGGASAASVTLTHRVRTDEYGSGREHEITAYAQRIDDELLDELELDRSRPWAIRLNGEEYVYGPGSAVLSRNSVDWDPEGEWQRQMTAERPSEADCHAAAQQILDGLLANEEEDRREDNEAQEAAADAAWEEEQELAARRS